MRILLLLLFFLLKLNFLQKLYMSRHFIMLEYLFLYFILNLLISQNAIIVIIIFTVKLLKIDLCTNITLVISLRINIVQYRKLVGSSYVE